MICSVQVLNWQIKIKLIKTSANKKMETKKIFQAFIFKKKMNKKAMEVLMKTTIYIVLVIAVLSLIYISISRIGSNSGIYEQVYAKQIALAIDKAKPGTDVLLDIFDLRSIADENKFTGNLIDIDNKDNRVIVKITEGKGYGFNFFNSAEIIWEIRDDNKLFFGVR